MAMLVFWHCLTKLLNMPGEMRQVPQTSWCISAAASNDQLCKGAHASLSAVPTWKGCEGPYKAFEGLRWFQLCPHFRLQATMLAAEDIDGLLDIVRGTLA